MSGEPRVQQEMFVTVSFTNPLDFALQDVQLAMEGPGLMEHKTHYYRYAHLRSRVVLFCCSARCVSKSFSVCSRVIDPGASISWTESFFPRLDGPRCLVAVLDCSSLHQVTATTSSDHITVL